MLRGLTATKQREYFVKLTFTKATEVGVGRKNNRFLHTIRLIRWALAGVRRSYSVWHQCRFMGGGYHRLHCKHVQNDLQAEISFKTVTKSQQQPIKHWHSPKLKVNNGEFFSRQDFSSDFTLTFRQFPDSTVKLPDILPVFQTSDQRVLTDWKLNASHLSVPLERPTCALLGRSIPSSRYVRGT